jgi:predicted alpha/beta superfamily hydrolase
MEKQTFNTDNKKITVYPAMAENRPVIYLTTYNDDGGEVYAEVQKGGCPDFTLVTVSGLNWEAELSPWAAGNLFKYSEMFTGGADDYLQFLTQQVIPQAETGLNGILWRGLTGYSLAGLFTVYALYKTDLFSRAASMSGSLWYPDFKDFALQSALCKTPQHLYFSLGDKEARARNQYLKTVQQCTEELAAHYRSLGINTCYELNPGGHYRNIISRSATGIKWILTQ